MAKKEKLGMMCGFADKIFNQIAHFLSYIDIGNGITFVEKEDHCVLMDHSKYGRLYGVNLQFESGRLVRAEQSIENLFRRLKTEEDGRVLVNFVKNKKEFFVYIYSANKSTVDSIASSFNVKIMSGQEIAKSFGDYFLFNSYEVTQNVLINNFDTFTNGCLENGQYHRIVSVLSKTALRNNDVYQAIAYKPKEFNAVRLFGIDGWEGTLSLFFDFSLSATRYKFDEFYTRSQKVDPKLFSIVRDVREKSLDVMMQDYGICNTILVCNDKKYIAQIESTTGFLFEENYLTGVSSYKHTLIKKRDQMFDFFISYKHAVGFLQSSKKKVDYVTQREDGSWIMPDFYGKDASGMFINYSLGQNKNPHLIITAKTGSGKSAALLKILRSSMWVDESFYSEAIENDLVKLRYVDIDYSGGIFVDRLRQNYKDQIRVYGSDASNMRFSLLDIDTEDGTPYSKPLEQEVKNICAFINTVLEATDPNSVLDNAEEERLRHSINKVFEDETCRIDLPVTELSMIDGYAQLGAEICKKYDKNIKISKLGSEYNFLKKPTFANVIDYVSKMSTSTSISEIQQGTYKTLLKKINGLKSFNFANHANSDISQDKSVFYVDFGEIKQNQKDFISLGWMLLRRWFKIDRETYVRRTAQGLPRQKIFYVIEESHNFFTMPSFSKVFQAAVKEVRKFGIHFVFISHTIKDMPDDIYKSIASKIFLFTEGDSDEVRREIASKTDMSGARLEVFNEAKMSDFAMFIMHDKGETVCKLEMTTQDLETFKPFKILP